MLRVYSILYLQQLWDRPVTQQTVVEEAVAVNQSADITTIKEINAVHHEEEQGPLYGTVNIVSSTTPISSSSSKNCGEQSSIVTQKQRKENDLPVISDELSYNSSVNTIINGKASSIMSIPVFPSRSETPLTQHHDEFFPSATSTVPVLNNSKVEREYYEDDISSDTDEQEEEDEVSVDSKKVDILSPSSIRSSRFSAKRILHRAKSSINEESVKRIGRRTSLFLEKFNHSQQSSVSLLPPISDTPQNAKNSNIKDDFSKGLRRQSSKLTGKGKTFTKKLKRVLSFHHPTNTTTPV